MYGYILSIADVNGMSDLVDIVTYRIDFPGDLMDGSLVTVVVKFIHYYLATAPK
jgi:hypothetical protein